MWLYEDKEFILEDDSSWYGFIYQIENLTNGKKYIGRKYFSSAKTKVVKGKKKRSRVESDWKEYYGSSPTLKADIDLLGKEQFKRTILYLCKGRAECSYRETQEIFRTDAILRDDFYNSWVSAKIHAIHLKHLLIEGTL